jgi:aspartyl aminopeptidase
MHSSNETAGARDVDEMIKALREFFGTAIKQSGDKIDF